MKVTFNKHYFAAFLLVLATETVIAVFYFHRFVRGFLGDVLVIPLLYFFVKTFSSVSPEKALSGILGFAFLVEILQRFNLSEKLNLQSKLINIILGNTFDPMDLIAYTTGAILVYLVQLNMKKQ